MARSQPAAVVGIRVPTGREARAFSRLDAAGVDAVHEHCGIVHADGCPIEAARAVALARHSLPYGLAAVVLCWAATAAVVVLLQGWVVNAPNGSVRGWALCVMASTIATGFTVVLTVQDHRSSRRNLERMRNAGPCADPWLFAGRWPRRTSVAGRLGASWPRPTVAVACLAGGVIALILSGSWLIAVLAAGWMAYTVPLLRRRTNRRHGPTPGR